MKRTIVLMIVVALAAVFAACGSAPAEVSSSPLQATAAPTPEPTAAPMPTPEQEQAPEAMMPESAEDVVSAMIENPQELFGEGRDQMAENNGGQFGSGVAEKRINEARMELFSGDDNAYMPLNTRLRDFGSENRRQQAILIKFQPENVSHLNFNFIGMGEFVISFEQDGLYFIDVKACNKAAFPDTGFNLKWDSLYYMLVAFDSNATLRCIVWEENAYQNQAYIEKSLYNGADDIYESNWQMYIGFEGGGQLNIYEYAVYTFDNLTENPPVLSGNDSVAGNEPAGFWSVKIGNFDAMSDGVASNVERRDVTIGGTQCTGYQLDALVAFANADAPSGAIIRFEDGSTEDVPDLASAYIVFIKDGQDLGNPYLGFSNKIYSAPVTEIVPN